MPVKNYTKGAIQENWSAPYGNFPGEPSLVRTYWQSYNNELVISGGNNGVYVRRGLGLPTGDRGGNFLVRRRFYDEYSSLGRGRHHFSNSTDPYKPGNPHSYVEQQARFHQFSDTDWQMPTPSTDIQMNALGTTAIARTAPTKGAADLATFLGETREGFPSAMGLSLTGKSRARTAKNAGDEYLNVEFGWKPLLRDVRQFANAVKNSHEILASYKRKSGVLLRRRYAWPVQSSFERVAESFRAPVPTLPGGCYFSGGPVARLNQINKSETKQWFTASYIYFVPDRGNIPDRWLSDANALLGAKLTPNMLWNLAPWSWAADWVGNFGDIAANMSYLNTDNLVLHHCYVMETKTFSKEYQLDTGINYFRTYPAPQLFRQVLTAQTKKRTVGTPYGFGLNWSGFNSKQLAILAALGISKTR